MIQAATEPGTTTGRRATAAEVDEEFSAYVAARRKALMRTAYLLAGDHHAAEDLVQSALARVYASWRRIRHRGAVDAYVRRTLLNEHLGIWRRAWRRFEHSTDEIPENAAPPPVVEDTDLDVELWNAIQVLAPRQRAVIVLRYYEDLSVNEIANALGCSEGTVKSTSARSIAKLREQLGTGKEVDR
ncbi:SigE family RNA polymerase sigma factor [Flindersiella endophytica]